MNKILIKKYLKNNIDNFKKYDFVVTKFIKEKINTEVEATVYNFSQFHRVYVTINNQELENFSKKLI